MRTAQRMALRRLHAFEQAAAAQVFGSRLDCTRVRVWEQTPWPNWLDTAGRWLARRPPRAPGVHNAVALGNCCFPVQLPAAAEALALGWLIHELAHVWQFQQLGWRYLWLALRAQLQAGDAVYDYGGAENLLRSRAQGARLQHFNVEQQAAILQHYYQLRCSAQDTAPYAPFAQDVHG